VKNWGRNCQIRIFEGGEGSRVSKSLLLSLVGGEEGGKDTSHHGKKALSCVPHLGPEIVLRSAGMGGPRPAADSCK